MSAKAWTDGKTFRFRMIFFGLHWKEITLYGEKHVRQTNNCLCKVSAVSATRKQNDHLRKFYSLY